MQTNENAHSCDLMVIGAGMAGMAATLFAVRKGLTVAQAGLTGETLYASGLFDLYGVSQGRPRELIDNPWQGLADLERSHPDHPFCKVTSDQILAGLNLFANFLKAAGHPYKGYADRNARLITPVGTIKRTFRVPATMWAGVKALEQKKPCLVVDIQGLRGFSAVQIVSTLKPAWPQLRAASIEIPGEDRLGPKYAEHIARSLDVETRRRDLADAIRPHLGKSQTVGLPAVLGIHDTENAHKDLDRLLGVPVFEIPTMPPAISGTRLKEAFDIHMPQLGVKTFYHHRVHKVEQEKNGRFVLEVGRTEPETTVFAERVLLATGRFLGKGLVPRREGIREALFDIPVSQPENRSCWHRETFLDPKGHAINLAGIEVDDRFRPLDKTGRPIYENLYAAGSILAHQDWIRTKSGTGLALATAYGAIEAAYASGKK
jgi:glycerol-3-phosphate dehydrogenase subunit B